MSRRRVRSKGRTYVSAPKASNAATPVSDAAIAAWFNPFGHRAGAVGEVEALSTSALYRGVSLISGTLAGLPLNTWTGEEQNRKKVSSVFDDPDGPDGQTPFEWAESLFIHLVLHGKAGALKVKNEAGGLARLPLVHPSSFRVEDPTQKEFESGSLPAGGLWFHVTLNDNTVVKLDAEDFWYVPAMSTDGQIGYGLLTLAADSLSTTIDGDKASGNTFRSGATISGLATPDSEGDNLDADDVSEVRRQLSNATSGTDNVGMIALVNRRLKFTPWTMTAQQAQFLESRQFQIEEIARWTGVPPHLLMQTDKQTSWGTGVDEQNRGLSKFVLGHWANRVEQRASRLLARPRWVQFDFAGLERPNFTVQTELVLQQIEKGLISPEYGRQLLGIPESAAPAEVVANDPPAE